MNNSENFESDYDNSLSFKELYLLCISKWKWFVISIACCLLLAVVYLLKTAPVYTRQATLLIKEDTKNGSSISSEIGQFSDMGLFTSSSNVNNELSTIQSPSMILETVRRLNLEIDCFQKGFFYDKTLYGLDNPVTITITGMRDKDACSFDLKVDKDGAIHLSDCKFNDVDTIRTEYSGKLNVPVSTDFGKVLVTKAPGFNKYIAEQDIDLKVVRTDFTSAVEAYETKLSASLADKKATIIDLSFEDISIQRAEDFLNTLISVYNESWLKDKNQIAVSTSRFIDERLQVIQKELGDVDNDISTYKSSNLIPDAESAAGVYLQQASDANTELIKLRNELYIARYIQNFISNEKNNNQLLPANSGIGNASIEKQIADYDEKVLQRNSLVSNSSTSNPLVQDLDKQLASMRSSILTAVSNQVRALNTQISGYSADQAATNSRIASGPTQAKYLLPKERQQKVKESLYLYLLQKREENELSQAFTAYNTRVICAPMGKDKPTSPVHSKIYFIAFFIGLLIPVVLIVIQENLDTRIRGRKDIESLTMPFLGELPQYGKRKTKMWLERLGLAKKRKEDERSYLVVQDRNRNVINEAFRVIRSNVELMMNDPNKKVIVMSSVNSGSGKTFIVGNLAAAFAIKHKRVVIVDLDLRKASTSKYVGDPHHGVTDYLIERIDDWHKVIKQPEGYSNYDIIPVGVMPPNPAELLFSPRLDKMIQELRQEYDYVFIDCPPIGVVADASVIVRHADLTIFVVRAGLLEREMLPEIERYYTEKKVPNMALLLNGTEAVGKGYPRYGYHYGYGYGYGYTSDDKKK